MSSITARPSAEDAYDDCIAFVKAAATARGQVKEPDALSQELNRLIVEVLVSTAGVLETLKRKRLGIDARAVQ